MKGFAHTRKPPQPTTKGLSVIEFKDLSRDWGLNKGFRESILRAIRSQRQYALIHCGNVTDIEIRWLAEHGFSIESTGNIVEVRI